MLRLYLFNIAADHYDAEHAAGVIAESEQEAIRSYRKVMEISDDDFEVSEIEITNGLVIEVLGYDWTGVRAHLPNTSDP